MSLFVDGWDQLSAGAKTRLRRQFQRVFKASGIEADVALLLCDDKDIRQLNADFRGKDKATDVLTFPAEVDPFFDEVVAAAMPLGDIAISVETAQRQAAKFEHSAEEELNVLLAHGLAHLVGYDHERSQAEARSQAEFELMLLDTAGVSVSLALCGRTL